MVDKARVTDIRTGQEFTVGIVINKSTGDTNSMAENVIKFRTKRAKDMANEDATPTPASTASADAATATGVGGVDGAINVVGKDGVTYTILPKQTPEPETPEP